MALKTKHASSMAEALLKGGIVSLATTLAGAAMVAKLVESGVLPETSVGYGVMAILLTASIGGSLASCRKTKRKYAQTALLAGLTYYLTLVAITALFFGGQYTAMGVTGLLVLAGSGMVLLLKMGKGRGKPKGSYPKAVRKIVQSDYR